MHLSLARLFVFVSFFFSFSALAAICSDVFPDAASSFSGTGGITFQSNAQLLGNDSLIDIPITQDLSSTSCGSVSCQYSGSPSDSLVMSGFIGSNSAQDYNIPRNTYAILDQGASDQVLIYNGGTLRYRDNNVLTRVNILALDNNATVIFDEGVYWIGYLYMLSNSTLSVNGTGKVTLYVRQSYLENYIRMNWSGDPDQLVIINYADFTMGLGGYMKGYLYNIANITWGNNAQFVGAMNATNISLGANGDFYYDASGISTAQFDGTCLLDNNLPDPLLYYSMDMCEVPANLSDEISGTLAPVEGSVSVGFAGNYCQNAELSGVQDFIDVPDSSLFNLSEGALAAWINVPDVDHNASPSAGRMTLFSKDVNASNNGGTVNIWIDDFGAIYGTHSDASGSASFASGAGAITENNWHHVVFTFGESGSQVFVDGILRAVNPDFTSGLSSNGVPMAIGANTWLYSPASASSRASQLRDFMRGGVDEVKLFNEQLNGSQVSLLFNEQSQTCSDCFANPTLISHWSADVCAFEQDVLVDVEGGFNGLIQKGISNEYTSRFCQGLKFYGNQSYATIAHQTAYELDDGTISMWFKVDDLSHSNNPNLGGNGLIAKTSSSNTDQGHLSIHVTPSGTVKATHQSSRTSETLESAALVQEGTWHHLVYTFGIKGMNIFLDGQLVARNENHNNGLQLNTDDIVLGATAENRAAGSFTATSYNDFLIGEMDEIKIYQYQANLQDVQAWYAETASNCTACSALIAQYAFEDNVTDSGQILDVSGNAFHGTLSSALGFRKPHENVYCQAMASSDNTSQSTKNYFDSNIDLNDLGEQGSISFWYRHYAAWNDGQRRMLIDASKQYGGTSQDKYFFLSKLEDGRLSFGIEDENDADLQLRTYAKSFAANEWVHIAVAWNAIGNTYQIFINGQEQALSTNSNAITGKLSDLGNLVFGDNLTDYVSGDMTSNAANGMFDDIRIYRQALGTTQFLADMAEATPCNTVDHFRIEHPATAITCSNPSVTIKACANADCSELSYEESSIDLTPTAAWSTPSVQFTATTTVTLQHRTAGTLTIGSSSQTPVAPIQCDNNCDIEYGDVGLEFFHVSSGSTDFTNRPFTAESGFAELGLRAVKSNGDACETLIEGTETIDISYQCVSPPGQSYSPSSCSVPFAGIALGASQPHSGSLSLDFDANGETNFAAHSYADVGVLQLTASATINGADLLPASSSINVIPDRLQMSIDSSATLTAGEGFTAQVDALGASGGLLPSYSPGDMELSAQRVAPLDAGAVDAEFNLALSLGAQTSASQVYESIQSISFNNGRFSSSDAYSEEVGQFTLRMRDSDYLGNTILSNEVTTGRFIPAYFDVQLQQQPEFADSCSSDFTYIGQPIDFETGKEIDFTVTAYNAIGQITQNYSADEWRLRPNQTALNSAFVYTDASVYSGALNVLDRGQGPVITGDNTFDGVATLSIDNSQFSYDKIAQPTGTDATPFDASVNLNIDSAFFTDTDGVCYVSSYPGACEDFNITNITGTSMRYGRIVMDNTFGPETQTLRVPMQSEYLLDGQWRISDTDSCSNIGYSLADGDISLVHDNQSPNDLTGLINDISASGLLLSGRSDENDFLIAPVSQSGDYLKGSFYMFLVPQSTNDQWSSHLNIDWDLDGDIDSDDRPGAAVSFGVYRGNDKTIHWREVF